MPATEIDPIPIHLREPGGSGRRTPTMEQEHGDRSNNRWRQLARTVAVAATALVVPVAGAQHAAADTSIELDTSSIDLGGVDESWTVGDVSTTSPGVEPAGGPEVGSLPDVEVDTPLEIDVTDVDFGDVDVNDSTAELVTVTNDGPDPFGPITPTFDQPVPAPFGVRESCIGETLEDGDTCLFVIRFHPSDHRRLQPPADVQPQRHRVAGRRRGVRHRTLR